MDTNEKIVVLIDADNIHAGYADKIIKKVASYGTPVVRRAYGRPLTFKNWRREILLKYAIEPVLRHSYAARSKNVADITLVIDAMDLMHRGKEYYDAFCIVSDDSDFAGLAMRLREEGMTVYGLGTDNAVESFVSACDVFFLMDLHPIRRNNKHWTYPKKTYPKKTYPKKKVHLSNMLNCFQKRN